MRGAFGPILTTGVALAAAGVVVANPIVAPRADVQIPAVQLSAGSGDAAGMLDQAFLDAIAPSPPESTNPFSVLRQLISSLAADATYLGKNAIVDAFVAGVTAVSQPELTASSTPYYPSIADSPELAASVLPGLDIKALAQVADLGSEVTGPVATVAEAVSPAVRTLVAGVVNDVGFVGGEIIAAAFAAGAVVAAEPGLIGDTLGALIQGDLTGALQSAVRAVAAPLGPPVIILNALRSVFERNLGAAAAVLVPALNVTAEPSETAAAIPAVPQERTVDVAEPPTSSAALAPATPGEAPTRTVRDSTVASLAGHSGTVVQSGPDAPSASDGRTEPTGTEQDSATVITAAGTRAQASVVLSSAGDGSGETLGKPRTPLRDAVDTVQQHVGAALTALGGSAGMGSDSAAGATAPRGTRAGADKAGPEGS